MIKLRFAIALFFSIAVSSIAQNTLSPKDFLGYEIGEKFTRHHQIVDYFKSVASTNSSMMKLENYGKTNEGRELILAFISSPENIEKLEQIKMNNRTYAGLTSGRVAPLLPNPPAIVWLSYNVHGNEPSSSEAAMLTLYELIHPSNPATKEWLKNCIVIIDPCINPDGRDRYVNWYNTTIGKNGNSDPQTREHFEVYPQGRTNHYNFDLNRDWAWQTQIETQQRLKKYLDWMPQIHVDFHEQGYNEPYYFAPAAEPMHEVITDWQKNFQTLSTKAAILNKLSRGAEGDAIMKEAMPLATMQELHQYGRQLLQQKKNKEALEIFKTNFQKNPNQFTTLMGLTRGYSANADYKNALKYANQALPLAPDNNNKNNVTTMIEKLKNGKDVN